MTTSIRHTRTPRNSLTKTRDTNFYQCGADERGHGPPVLRQGNPPLRHPVHGTAQHTATAVQHTQHARRTNAYWRKSWRFPAAAHTQPRQQYAYPPREKENAIVALRNRRGWSKQPLTYRGWRLRYIFLQFFSCVFLCGSGISFCRTRAPFAVNLNWLAGRSSGSST